MGSDSTSTRTATARCSKAPTMRSWSARTSSMTSTAGSSPSGIEHWADPSTRTPGQINHNDGGRGVYFRTPTATSSKSSPARTARARSTNPRHRRLRTCRQRRGGGFAPRNRRNMMGKRRTAVVVASATIAAGLISPLGGVGIARAAVTGGPVLALTAANTLFGFNADAPTLTQNTPITGLQPGESSSASTSVRPPVNCSPSASPARPAASTSSTRPTVRPPPSPDPFSTRCPPAVRGRSTSIPRSTASVSSTPSGASLRLNPFNGALGGDRHGARTRAPTAVAYDRSTRRRRPRRRCSRSTTPPTR